MALLGTVCDYGAKKILHPALRIFFRNDFIAFNGCVPKRKGKDLILSFGLLRRMIWKENASSRITLINTSLSGNAAVGYLICVSNQGLKLKGYIENEAGHIGITCLTRGSFLSMLYSTNIQVHI